VLAIYAFAMSEISEPKSENEPSVIHFQLAYEATLREAAQQEATLDELRSRAIGILSAVVVATSILAAVTGSSWISRLIASLSVMFFIYGIARFFKLLLPSPSWRFVQPPEWVMSLNENGESDRSAAAVYERYVRACIPEHVENATKIENMQKLFQRGLKAFLVELVIWSLVVGLH